MFRVELAKAVRRWRTWALAAALGAIPALIVVGVAVGGGRHHGNEGGPPFINDILRSGFFAPLTALAVVQPFFLPLTAGLLSGDAIAGEATSGTLRYLLTRPVGRRRLVTSKYLSVMALVLLASMWIAVAGTISGGIAFHFGPLPTLSGSTISGGAAIARIALSAVYVAGEVASLAAIGLFISTLTESSPGATVATVIVAIVSQILDSLSQLRVIHPYLLSHDWTAFVDLFRDPVSWHNMIHGVIVDAVYVAIFLGAALTLFRRKDVLA